MNYDEKIHLSIILFISIFLFSINFILLIYSKTKYFINNRPCLLMVSTLTIIVLCDLHLIKVVFGEKIHHLIYFNLQNISIMVCISFYSYRGLITFINNDINKIKNLRICFLLLNILTIFYILFINVFYYNINIESNDWQYYPIWIIYFIYLLIFHPYIIYKLNNYDIRNDYIYSMILLITGFIIESVDIIYPSIYYHFNNYEIIKRYIHFITTFFTCVSYSLIPLIKNLILKYKKDQNIKERDNIYKIPKKLIEDIEIMQDDKNNIYKKYFIK